MRAEPISGWLFERPLTSQEAFRWALRQLGWYAGAAVAGAAIVFAWAAFYTYVWPGIPAPPKPARPEFQAPTSRPTAPEIPVLAPDPSGPWVSLPPPPDALMGASVLDEGGRKLIGHVAAVGFNEKGIISSVIINVDYNEERKTVAAPMRGFVWHYTAAVPNSAKAVGRLLNSDEKTDWVTYKPTPTIPPGSGTLQAVQPRP
jgi:hypothetical protein